MLNYLGLPDGTLDYIVDDSPARQGYFVPGVHIPIFGSERLKEEPPDFILLLAWSYEKEIRKKTTLPMIVPLPEIKMDGGK